MYDIDFAKKLDDKTSNVNVQGKVTYNQPPKHVVSPEGASRAYDFWSQFLVIEDKNDSIGINISFGEEEDKKKNGDIIEVKGEIHKYEADNKKTGKKEEKIVLNKAKIIEPEKEKVEKETTKKQEPKVVNINNNYKISQEQEIRRESVITAFDYGSKNELAIYDCFDLAKTIGIYIKSGEIDIKKIVAESELIKKEKPKPKAESKPKVEKEKPEEKVEEKSTKNNKDLEKLFYRGQEIGLATWVELVGFAVKKDIFPIGTSVEDARAKLLENKEDCYNSLNDFIDIREDVSNLPEDERPTEDIPF